jgi:hypothetical protein
MIGKEEGRRTQPERSIPGRVNTIGRAYRKKLVAC